jgi:hypothetical protein
MFNSFHSRLGISATFVLNIVGKNTSAKEMFILAFICQFEFFLLYFVRKSYISVITRRYVRKKRRF